MWFDGYYHHYFGRNWCLSLVLWSQRYHVSPNCSYFCNKIEDHNINPCCWKNLKCHLVTGEKPHQCTVCGRCFRTNYMLKVHTRLHTGEKNFNCKECGALFAERGALVSHLRIHTGVKPFICTFCGCKFAQSPALKRHLRIHTKVCTILSSGNWCSVA